MRHAWVLVVLLATGISGCREDGQPVTSPAPPTWTERVVSPRRATSGPPPLLVMLHGIGADENDLLPLADAFDPRLLVVSLRAPRRHQVGYAWFALAWRDDGTVVPDAGQARETLAQLRRWLAAAPGRLGADAKRVYLLGFSQGAMMSLGVLVSAPETVAGVVALSGHFSESLVDVQAPPEQTAGVPVFVAHGIYDDVLPIASGRAVRDALKPRVRDLTDREYPIGHGIAPDELRDAAVWLTERLAR